MLVMGCRRDGGQLDAGSQREPLRRPAHVRDHMRRHYARGVRLPQVRGPLQLSGLAAVAVEADALPRGPPATRAQTPDPDHGRPPMISHLE